MKKNSKLQAQLKTLDETRETLYARRNISLPLALLFPVLFTIIAMMVHFMVPIFYMLVSGIISAAAYHLYITVPFNELKGQVREVMLDEFMQIYHPGIDYVYSPLPDRKVRQNAKSIIQYAQLVSCNHYKEEDIMEGKAGDINFYLSEIKLSQSSGKSTQEVFKGLLFKIKLPGRTLPTARIQSQPGLIKKVFGKFVEKKKWGFWYETRDAEIFHEQMGDLFPFIRYLIANNGDLRIHTHQDEMTILLSSEMKFLDDPKPALGKSFQDETYYQNIGKQINSLLFIVESFAGQLEKTEVEERLELKPLEPKISIPLSIPKPDQKEE